LIKAIAAGGEYDRMFWTRTIAKGDQGESDLEHAINLMHTTGAIEATRKDALDWSNKAQKSISLLPESELKTILQDLAIYVLSRVS
jgi:octaprenyl-diphosphate synthase